MKVKDIEGFDYDYLGNWEYLNKEIAIAFDEAGMFNYLRSQYIAEGMKFVKEKFNNDFWDLYTSVADNVATEVQNGKHTGILEAVMSTEDTFYKCVRENYTSDILYRSDDKHTVSNIARKALSDALYEMITHNDVSNYLNMKLATALYEKWYGSTDNFPYKEVAEYLKNSPAYTIVKIEEFVQGLQKIFTHKKITITVEVPINFSTGDLQCILEKHFHSNIEIAEN